MQPGYLVCVFVHVSVFVWLILESFLESFGSFGHFGHFGIDWKTEIWISAEMCTIWLCIDDFCLFFDVCDGAGFFHGF